MPSPGPRQRMRGIPNDLEFKKNLYTTVGRLVVGFGLLDFGLDMLVGVLYRDFDGASKQWKKIPVPFEKRIEFIADCAQNLETVRRHRSALQRIVDRAPPLASIRNDIAHGYPASYRRSDHLLTYVKAGVDKQRRSFQMVKMRDITVRQLLRASTGVIDLAAQVSTLNHRMADDLDSLPKAK